MNFFLSISINLGDNCIQIFHLDKLLEIAFRLCDFVVGKIYNTLVPP